MEDGSALSAQDQRRVQPGGGQTIPGRAVTGAGRPAHRGVAQRLALALPVPCHVPVTKFLSQSQCSHLLNEENSNLLEVARN